MDIIEDEIIHKEEYRKGKTEKCNLKYENSEGKSKCENKLVDEMATTRIAKRGVDKDDNKWFSKEAVLKLQVAREEVEWLLNRGYNINGIMELVGGRNQFSVRQREALKRSTSSKDKYEKRKSKLFQDYDMKDGCIYIDGFNLIITLEVALSGGVLILGNDGSIRDLAGLRGTYSIIDKTDKALELIGKVFNKFKISQATFFLDAPVSNSGRLKARILRHALDWRIPTEIMLVPNADPILSQMGRIVTSDSVILDNCISWFNISRRIIEDYIKDAKIIDLSGDTLKIQ